MVYRSQWIVGDRALEMVGSVMRVRVDKWKGYSRLMVGDRTTRE